MMRGLLFALSCVSLSLSFPSHYFISFPTLDELLSRPSGRPFTISVEGNVGAGKSTLLKYFSKYPEIVTYTEPLDVWQNLNGTNFLELMYSDPKRWAMSFESLVSLTMLETHAAITLRNLDTYSPVKVMERSVHSARACFIENMASVMDKAELGVLDAWYRFFVGQDSAIDTEVDLVIYLQTSPEGAMSRVRSRNRKEELEIPAEFFQNIHQLHEDWLIKRNSSAGVATPQVLIINADQDLSVLSKTYESLAHMVWKMIPQQLVVNNENQIF